MPAADEPLAGHRFNQQARTSVRGVIIPHMHMQSYRLDPNHRKIRQNDVERYSASAVSHQVANEGVERENAVNVLLRISFDVPGRG